MGIKKPELFGLELTLWTKTMMLKIFVFYILARNMINSEPDFTVILYNISASDDLILDYKTLCKYFARKINHTFKAIIFETAENISQFDVNLVDANNYSYLDPNPFILPSVTSFFSLTFMIPSIGRLEKFLYFFLPFSRMVWRIIAASSLYFALALKLSQRHISYANHLTNALTIMVSRPVVISTNSLLGRLIYLTIIGFSMIVSTLYTSYLGLFLTTNIERTQFTFLCPESRLFYLKPYCDSFICRETPYGDYLLSMNNLNLNYGYCVTSNYWTQKTGQFFKIVIPWKTTYGHYIRINRNTKHLESFNKFVIECFSSGLMIKWENDMKHKNYSKQILSYLKEENHILKEKHFKFPAIIFGTGILLAVILFIMEVMRYKYNQLNIIFPKI